MSLTTMEQENEHDRKRKILDSDHYCVECARFYEPQKLRTWVDFIEGTGSITIQCPRGHVWEEA